MKDMLEVCYEGDHQKQPLEQFKKMFCDQCRNPQCQRSRVGRSAWATRMEHQLELMNDPRFSSKQYDGPEFKNLVQEVLALEVTRKKQNWEIPTNAEIQQEAQALLADPEGFKAAPEIKHRWTVASATVPGKTYQVTEDVEGAFLCDCPSKNALCPHILEVKQKLTRAAPPENPIEPVAIMNRPPPFTPRATNTEIPPGGFMVGGGRPTNQPQKVAVGGKFVLGGKK